MHNFVMLIISMIVAPLIIQFLVLAIWLFGRALAFMGEKITARMWEAEDEGDDDIGR